MSGRERLRIYKCEIVMLRGTGGVLIDGIETETETEIEIELRIDDGTAGRNQIGRVSGFEAARHW